MMIKDPQAPATPSQTSYLASLVEQRDLPEVCQRYQLVTTLGMLTKGQASEWIDQLLKAPKKAAKTLPSQTPAQAYVSQAQSFADSFATKMGQLDENTIEPPAFGYYEGPDGQLYYWDVTTRDWQPQLRYLVLPTGGGYWAPKKASWKKTGFYGTGSKKATMTFQPYGKNPETTKTVTIPAKLVELVAAGAKPMTMQQAAAKGKACGYCIRCGTQLTDEKSVAQGLGPVCIKYWGTGL